MSQRILLFFWWAVLERINDSSILVSMFACFPGRPSSKTSCTSTTISRVLIACPTLVTCPSWVQAYKVSARQPPYLLQAALGSLKKINNNNARSVLPQAGEFCPTARSCWPAWAPPATQTTETGDVASGAHLTRSLNFPV